MLEWYLLKRRKVEGKRALTDISDAEVISLQIVHPGVVANHERDKVLLHARQQYFVVKVSDAAIVVCGNGRL